TARRSGDLLAGTLDRLAYSVESPLLIMRDERPFERWAADGGELRVMLAFDRTASSAIARDWLARLAQFGTIDLSVLHLYWARDEYERHGKKVPVGDEGHEWLVQTMKKEIESELGHLPPNVKVNLHTEMASGRIDTHLIDLASAAQVDLMLLGTHRRRALGRLWSVSHHVMLQAPMAVACVPATTPVPHIAGAPAWNSALCVSDFSESSSRVAAWAATLLRSGGTLHLAYVTPEIVSEERRALLLDKLRETLPPATESNALKVEVHVLHGLAEKALAQAADRLGVDLICLGSKPASGFEKAQSGILAPAAIDQWRLVQSLLETTGKPVFIAPALRA
ncbi:MAG: universal stress protein, partial [Acidobacteriota bacterium]